MISTAATVFERLPRFFRRHQLMKAWMLLTGEDPLQLVRIRGDAFGFADMDEGFLRLIVIDQGFEADFFRIADALLQRGGTFFDVGANYGLFSFGLAHKHDSINFHLFEPNPKVIAAVRRTLELYPDMRCTLNTVAVSDHVGFVNYKIVPDHTGISRVVATGGDRVPATTLDRYFEDAAIPSVTLLKMDIEGHELAALKGAQHQLESGSIKAIYFEYMENNLGTLAPEVLRFLDSMGFEVCFCRPCDVEPRRTASHTIRSDLPGHGLPLLPVKGWPMPSATDLLAIPKSRLVPTGD